MTEVLLDKKRKIRVTLGMLDRFQKSTEERFDAMLSLIHETLRADSPELTREDVANLIDADVFDRYREAYVAEVEKLSQSLQRASGNVQLPPSVH
jgi:hypothetical protein